VKQIRVLLADEHTLVRSGIRALLEKILGVEIVAEAGDGHEALRLIKLHQPDVALIDIALPKLNGLEVAARAGKDFPGVRVTILSIYASADRVWQALRSSAVGYLLKSAEAADLEQAIKATARGETYLSPAISRQVIRDYARHANSEGTQLDRLTPRQREVLQLIAEGYTTKAIAQMLKISVKTVETHRAQLMDRLGIHDVAGLVRYAIQIGLSKLEG
jgi:DNA-binding NarL/FixJ family response regulator